MADSKISNLDALAAVDLDTDNDLVAIVDASATQTKKITVADLVSDKADLSGAAFTGAVLGNTQELAVSSSSLTLSFGTYQNFVLTLGASITLNDPTTETVGQSGFIVFIQDATGSRTVSLTSTGQYYTAGTHGLTLSTTAGAVDIVPYIVQADGKILLGTPQLNFVNA